MSTQITTASLEGIMEDKTGQQLIQLLDKLELINFFLDALDEFIKRSPWIMESLNQEIIKLREQTSSSETLKENIVLIGELLRVLTSENFKKTLLGIIDAYEKVMEQDERKGLVGILRGTSDPDVQRALAFIILALKKWGEAMK